MTALTDWIGRTETREDMIAPRSARLMQATLDQKVSLAAGDPLPPLWHWLYFPSETATAGLGPDGHTARGGFLPPVPLPRRMWAGGRFTFKAPLAIGETATRRSTIEKLELKEGRSGELCFVTVAHRLSQGRETAFTEAHDIVYREAPAPGAAPPAPPAPPPAASASLSRVITPSMPLLFRYSALTFNAHRIHYDLDYCRDVEGYPGCIVHGPLIATLLVGLAAELAAPRPLASFAFRATAPLFHTAPFTIRGGEVGGALKLWAETPEGGLAMTAEATLA